MSAISLISWTANATAFLALLVVTLTIIHKRKNPNDNYRASLLSTLLVPLRLLKIGPYSSGDITMEKAMKRAMNKTGLSDFGDLTFVETYKKVTDTAFFQNLTLSNMGYLVAKTELEILLVKRLKFVDYMKNSPEVLKIPLKNPVFVFGLGNSH